MQACWRTPEPMSSQNGGVFFLRFSECLRVSCNTDISLCKLFTGVVVMLAYIRRWTMSARSRCRTKCLCWRRLAAVMVLGAIAAKLDVVGCRLLPEMNTRPIPNVNGLAAILRKATCTIMLRLTKNQFNHSSEKKLSTATYFKPWWCCCQLVDDIYVWYVCVHEIYWRKKYENSFFLNNWETWQIVKS